MNNTAKSTAVTAFARSTAFAALGCFVSLTTPPKSNPKPYWSVQVRNETANYSPRYRLMSEARAYEVAMKIADDRGIGVKVKAAPERPVIHPPAAQA